MASILIIATCYDRSTQITSSWARRLQHDLIAQGHTATYLDGSLLTGHRATLRGAIAAADVVVYYGHGTADQWLGMPGVAFVDCLRPGRVRVLQGKQVYAGCCSSLTGLGNAYAATYPAGGFIGYAKSFQFEATNEWYFGDIVNLSVLGFVNGSSHTQIESELRAAWQRLRDEFLNGWLQHKPDAFNAAFLADDNANAQNLGAVP